jgi:hypothetical protein
MDTMPPQAPPAITRSSQQDAIDAVQRISDAQAWILAQQPLLRAAYATHGVDDFSEMQRKSGDFWRERVRAPGDSHDMPRSSLLGRQLGVVMKDEAWLRSMDGTLGQPAADLAMAFARSAGHPLPPHVHAHELVLGNVAYAGAVVVTDDRNDALALMFSPDRGWDEFADMDALLTEAEETMREKLAEPGLLTGVLATDVMPWVTAQITATREIDADVFDTLSNRILQHHMERALLAWSSAPATAGGTPSPRQVDAADLAAIVDVSSVMASRYARLADALDDQHLAGIPDHVKNDWQAAADGYRTWLATHARESADYGLTPPAPLPLFVHDGLKERLTALGIHDDPEDIVVDIHDFTAAYFYNPTGVVDQSVLGPARMRLTLAELALKNVGVLDNDILFATKRDGLPLAYPLDRGALRNVIRDFDAATGYATYLRDVLKNTSSGQLSRALSVQLLAARMRFRMEEARLAYFRATDPRSFADDHDYRGYRWVKAVLDSPAAAQREKVDGHDVVVRQLTYENEAFKDILVIGPREPDSVSSVVYFTPDAPDGIDFREFATRRDALGFFMASDALRGYLLGRLPRHLVTTLSSGRERRFAQAGGDRQANWSFSGTNTYGATAASFGEQVILGHVFEASYDHALSQLTANIGSVARTTGHADADNFSPRIDGELVGRGVASLIGRATEPAWRAYDQLKAGNVTQSFVDFTDAYMGSLDFLMLGTLKGAVPRPVAIRASRQSTRLAATRTTLRDAEPLFGAEYVDAAASLRHADSFQRGVYRIGGQPYVEKSGHVYRVRYDTNMSTWRLCQPRHCDATSAGQPITRDAAGVWAPSRPGLPGGAPPLWVQQSTDPSSLTIWQAAVRDEALTQAVGHEAAWRIKLDITRQRRNLMSDADQASWDSAVTRGSHAPVERPVTPDFVVLPVPSPPPAAALPAAAPRTAPVARVPPVARAPAPAGIHGAPVLTPPPAANAPMPLLHGRQADVLPVDQWPDTVWIYPMPGRPYRAVGQYSVPYRIDGEGLRGVRASLLAPEAHAAGEPRRRTIPYVRVDLRALRLRQEETGRWGAVSLTRVGPREGPGGNADALSYVLINTPRASGLTLRQGEFSQGRLVDIHRLRNGMTMGQPNYQREAVPFVRMPGAGTP